jgi:hypothetical protein
MTQYQWVETRAEKKALQDETLSNKYAEWGRGDASEQTAALTSNV